MACVSNDTVAQAAEEIGAQGFFTTTPDAEPGCEHGVVYTLALTGARRRSLQGNNPWMLAYLYGIAQATVRTDRLSEEVASAVEAVRSHENFALAAAHGQSHGRTDTHRVSLRP